MSDAMGLCLKPRFQAQFFLVGGRGKKTLGEINNEGK